MTLARKTLALLSVLILSTSALSAFALAQGTRTWEQSRFDELTKGTAKGVALRSEGGLELAPAFKALATTPSTYIWSIASDAAGNIYAAPCIGWLCGPSPPESRGSVPGWPPRASAGPAAAPLRNR